MDSRGRFDLRPLRRVAVRKRWARSCAVGRIIPKPPAGRHARYGGGKAWLLLCGDRAWLGACGIALKHNKGETKGCSPSMAKAGSARPGAMACSIARWNSTRRRHEVDTGYSRDLRIHVNDRCWLQADMGGVGRNPTKPTRTTRPDYVTRTSAHDSRPTQQPIDELVRSCPGSGRLRK